ncbi:MAG: hypothetical protein K8T89_00155 [Planctomycetes bacterium]|nr:hypothetical protein [Planctomycetota bacterium]
MFRSKMLAAAIVSLGLLSGLRAETKPEETNNNPPVVVKTETKPLAPGVVDNAKLKEMLETLGYDVRESKSGSTTYYWIQKSADGLDFSLAFSLGGTQEKIFTHVTLANFTDKQLAKSDRMVKLLNLNDMIGPCYFLINPKTKQLYLTRVCENRGMTPRILKDHIGSIVDRAAETKEHWMASKW